MEPLSPSILIDQVDDLPNLAEQLTKPYDRVVRTLFTHLEYLSFRHVYITGDGDSYHAARAAELAFESIGHIPCEPHSGQRYLDYTAATMRSWAPHDLLVIGISASGRTQRVVQSLERARSNGAMTLAITGVPDSQLAQVAERTLLVEVPDMGPSPGIRTYNASLMGLLLLAIRIGEIKGHVHQMEANGMRKELAALSEVLAATAQASKAPAQAAAEAFKEAGIFVYLGSGPSYGTALFSAAKIVEAANEFATGQDLEEWQHVENIAYPDDMPTLIIAPYGRSHWRAVEAAETATKRGRRVVAICQDGDEEMKQHAGQVFPVMGAVREEFSPLVYHLGADLFAAYLTEALGFKIFRPENPAFGQVVANYRGEQGD